FKTQKRLFTLNGSYMKEKNDEIINEESTNSSKMSSTEIRGLVEAIRTEKHILMDLPTIKQIYDKNKEDMKNIYDKHQEDMKNIYDKHKEDMNKIYDEMLQKLETKDKEIDKLKDKQNDYVLELNERTRELFMF